MDFWSKLRDSINKRDSLLCVGLDLNPERMPAGYAGLADWGRAVVAATAPYACAFKPNIAFYESAGIEGLQALAEILQAIPADIPVILDAKRNDIASTADAYARAVFEQWHADAVTLNPYLGNDGIAPFAAYADRGLFILCKTSNPSAGELQDWTQQGVPLYQHVAELAQGWAQRAEVGLVIGATYPEAIADMRSRWPHTWFLIPGIGAQGGDLEAVMEAGLDVERAGVLINASRAVIQSPDPAQAARELRDQINAHRRTVSAESRPSARQRQVQQLAQGLFAAGCLRFGDFELASGAHSPIYVDLRRLVTHPSVLALVARAYAQLLQTLQYDRIAAIPYAALPIGTAVALQTGDPLLYPRREAKSYGTRQAVEGEYHPGETVVLLDDLITGGGSKLQAAIPLQEAGLLIRDVVVLIDREQGGRHDLSAHGLQLHAVLTLRELVDALQTSGDLDSDQADRVRDYLGAAAR
jgi:uridine monophosphate synthetase